MSANPAIENWSNQRVWIIGASTGIGESLAKQLVKLGARVALSARSKDKLESISKQLTGSHALALDITDIESVHSAATQVIRMWGGIDVVIIMAGTYIEMQAKTFDLEKARTQINVNLLGVLNVLDAALPQLLKQNSGHLSIVASVAGYRGLPNSIVYGPTKAALINMAESLYLDLKASGIAVSVIEPGFVDTPLTKKNTFPMPFLITADQAAAEIVNGFAKGQFEIHFPKTFTRILRLLKLLPWGIYSKIVKKMTGL